MRAEVTDRSEQARMLVQESTDQKVVPGNAGVAGPAAGAAGCLAWQ
jgi:hypothetical protein